MKNRYYNIKNTGLFVTPDGDAVTDPEKLLLPSCKCGIDCCNGLLVLPNYSSISGDSVIAGAYLLDGELVVLPLQEAIDAIAALKANVLVSATSVVISGCSEDDLVVEDTLQLTKVVLPSGSLQTGTWSSSVPGVATVNSSGLVTAVGVGTTIITFTSTDGEFTDTCSVTVVAE